MGAGFHIDEIRAIEQAAVYAWPATETRCIDGWLWRCSGGHSQRANSVSPLRFAGADAGHAVARVEALYRARGQPVRFQVGRDLAAPVDLDRRLETAGYRLVEPVATLAKRIGAVAVPAGVETSSTPSDGWMDVYLANIAPDRRLQAPAILAGVPAPRTFFAGTRDGAVISTALGVVHGGVVVAECVGTRGDVRRSGGAAAVMLALEAWGAGLGATIAGLQAVVDNTPAQRLYAGLGYVEVNRYHYRVLDQSPEL